MSVCLLALALFAAQEPTTVLPAVPVVPTEENLATWTRYLEEAADEQRWREIPWLASFADGLDAAHEQEKPLLLWAMNGHPLGCT